MGNDWKWTVMFQGSFTSGKYPVLVSNRWPVGKCHIKGFPSYSYQISPAIIVLFKQLKLGKVTCKISLKTL